MERTVEYELKDSGYIFTMLPDGGIYIADSDGIHKRNKDGTLWETIVDGRLNSLSLPKRELEALIVMQDEKEEDYYTYGINGDGEIELMHYYFDMQVTAISENEISIYSLEENATLRQAAVQFQKKHADIRINYQVAMGVEGGNISDYIKTLNTELLAGADILVLDDLPIDRYIEKGVLADVSDFLGTSDGKNVLFTNISDSYKNNGKQYGMPLRFGVPLILGKKESLEAINSLTHAVVYAKSLGKDKLFEPMSYSELAEIFMAIEWKNLFDENHKRKESDLIQYLNNLKVISDHIGAYEEKDARKGFMDLHQHILNSQFAAKKSKLGIDYATNIYDLPVSMCIAKEKNMEMSTLNDIFVPKGIVALNKAGKNIEIAREFYEFLFSEEIQDVILYDGYPVNKNSFSKWLEVEEKDSELYSIIGESGEAYVCRWPEKEEWKKSMKVIGSLSNPLESDRTLKDSVKEGILSMLNGEKSVEEAAVFIYRNVNMYMAE